MLDPYCGPSHTNAWYDDFYGPLRVYGYLPHTPGSKVDGTILDCPGIPNTNDTANGYADGTNYAYNSWLPIQVGWKYIRITKPTWRALFADSDHYVITWNSYSTKLYPAHNGSPTFLFADGHAMLNKEPTLGSDPLKYRKFFDSTGSWDDL
jgi:prepilin-type processing-associated H-X9-DG protein